MRWVSLLAMCASCGGAVGEQSDAGMDGDASTLDARADARVEDAGADVDNGMPSDMFPFPHPPLPQIVNLGGTVMKSPKIVPIVYQTDGYELQIGQFIYQFAGSSYFTNAVKEYGVGPATATSIFEITGPPPSTIDDFQIQALLSTRIGKNGWPAADNDTIFTIFFPQQTQVTYPNVGTSCVKFWSYHSEMPLDGGGKAAYAVIPRCPKLFGWTGFDVVTARAANAIINATTNPFPVTSPGWGVIDDDHFAWTILPGPGPASLCQWERQGYQALVGGYIVHSTWSNLLAKTDQNPCAPQHAMDPYFNAAPLFPDVVTVSGGAWGMKKTRGIKIPVGQSRTLDVVLFSSAKTAPFSVQAVDGAQVVDPASAPNLDFAWDRDSGVNGEKLHLTIKVIHGGPYGGSNFVIWSQWGSITHSWWGFVEN
jgi:hypothetical protein